MEKINSFQHYSVEIYQIYHDGMGLEDEPSIFELAPSPVNPNT